MALPPIMFAGFWRQSLLKKQQRVLAAETVMYERIAKSGMLPEIDRAISRPETIRSEALKANPAAAETMKNSTWRELWQQMQEPAEGQPAGPGGSAGGPDWSVGPTTAPQKQPD